MKSISAEKSLDFAVDIVKCVKLIRSEHKEYILSKQILRSGTAIGAMIWEAQEAESGLDFIHKMKVSQKETRETMFWLLLLKRSHYIDETDFVQLFSKCEELFRMLTSIIITKRKNLNKKDE